MFVGSFASERFRLFHTQHTDSVSLLARQSVGKQDQSEHRASHCVAAAASIHRGSFAAADSEGSFWKLFFPASQPAPALPAECAFLGDNDAGQTSKPQRKRKSNIASPQVQLDLVSSSGT